MLMTAMTEVSPTMTMPMQMTMTMPSTTRAAKLFTFRLPLAPALYIRRSTRLVAPLRAPSLLVATTFPRNRRFGDPKQLAPPKSLTRLPANHETPSPSV